MRTLEELMECEYKDLTYGELCEYDLGCDCCPLNGNFCTCNGNMVCYGGEPIEPPCCSFDPEENLYEIERRWRIAERQEYERQLEKIRKGKLKEQKSKERKEKLRQYKRRNWENLNKIDILKKKIKKQEKYIDYIERVNIYASVVNDVNKMFRDARQPNDVKDIDKTPITEEINKHKAIIEEYNKEIQTIKKEIKESEKIYKSKNKGK